MSTETFLKVTASKGERVKKIDLSHFPRITVQMIGEIIGNKCLNVTELSLNSDPKLMEKEQDQISLREGGSTHSLYFRREKLSKLTEFFPKLESLKIPEIQDEDNSIFRPFFLDENKKRNNLKKIINEFLNIELSIITKDDVKKRRNRLKEIINEFPNMKISNTIKDDWKNGIEIKITGSDEVQEKMIHLHDQVFLYNVNMYFNISDGDIKNFEKIIALEA